MPALKQWLAFHLLPWTYHLLCSVNLASCSRHIIGQKILDQLGADGQNWIYSSWHENVAVGSWALKNQQLATLISNSNDGEYIARAVAAFDNIPIRGSSSANGARATREILRFLNRGHSATITPDGPRGPRRQLQMGVIALAAMSARPLIPYHIEANRQWQFSSWDRHKMPKPFSRLVIGFGAPYYVDKQRFKTEAESIRQEFESVMNSHAKHIRQLAQA